MEDTHAMCVLCSVRDSHQPYPVHLQVCASARLKSFLVLSGHSTSQGNLRQALLQISYWVLQILRWLQL